MLGIANILAQKVFLNTVYTLELIIYTTEVCSFTFNAFNVLRYISTELQNNICTIIFKFRCNMLCKFFHYVCSFISWTTCKCIEEVLRIWKYIYIDIVCHIISHGYFWVELFSPVLWCRWMFSMVAEIKINTTSCLDFTERLKQG